MNVNDLKDGQEIFLELIPSDFKGNRYMDIKDCAVTRCLKRNFPNQFDHCGGDVASVIETYYDKGFRFVFGPDDFELGKQKAEKGENTLLKLTYYEHGLLTR